MGSVFHKISISVAQVITEQSDPKFIDTRLQTFKTLFSVLRNVCNKSKVVLLIAKINIKKKSLKLLKLISESLPLKKSGINLNVNLRLFFLLILSKESTLWLSLK